MPSWAHPTLDLVHVVPKFCSQGSWPVLQVRHHDQACLIPGCQPTSDCCEQTYIELDDGAAAAMAEFLKSMRGAGAVGTTNLECRRMTPATMRDIQRVNSHSF